LANLTLQYRAGGIWRRIGRTSGHHTKSCAELLSFQRITTDMMIFTITLTGKILQWLERKI
jgi:hypothetical protein